MRTHALLVSIPVMLAGITTLVAAGDSAQPRNVKGRSLGDPYIAALGDASISVNGNQITFSIDAQIWGDDNNMCPQQQYNGDAMLRYTVDGANSFARKLIYRRISCNPFPNGTEVVANETVTVSNDWTQARLILRGLGDGGWGEDHLIDVTVYRNGFTFATQRKGY